MLCMYMEILYIPTYSIIRSTIITNLICFIFLFFFLNCITCSKYLYQHTAHFFFVRYLTFRSFCRKILAKNNQFFVLVWEIFSEKQKKIEIINSIPTHARSVACTQIPNTKYIRLIISETMMIFKDSLDSFFGRCRCLRS